MQILRQKTEIGSVSVVHQEQGPVGMADRSKGADVRQMAQHNHELGVV